MIPESSFPDKIDIVKATETKMAAVADALRETKTATAMYKDYENVQMGDDDPTEKQNYRLNNQTYRAASGLLAVYDQKGAMALATTIAEIRRCMQGPEINLKPNLDKDITAILAEHYLYDIGLTNRGNGITSTRRQFLFGTAATVASGAWALKRRSTRLDAEERKKQAEALAIDLESEPTPTKEQKKALLELQRIELPAINQTIEGNNEWGWPALTGAVGIIMAITGLTGESVKVRTTTMERFNDILTEACRIANVQTFYVPEPPKGRS